MKLSKMSEKGFRKRQIRKIKSYLEKAEIELGKLSNESIDYLYEFHNENSSLPYCIRWGLTATEELLKEEKEELI